MVAEEYLKQQYHEDYPRVTYFSHVEKLLREKKRQQKKTKNLKKAKPIVSDNSHKISNIRQYNAFYNVNKQQQGILIKSLNSLLDLSVTLAKYTLIAGGALFTLQELLRKTEYLAPEQTITSGVAARIGGKAIEYDTSGRSKGIVSENGLKFIEQAEGLRTTAYQDTRKVWTIGIGHTGLVDGKPIHAGMTISEAKARELFKQDIKKYENYVNKVVKVPISQNMFDAMVSYAFNVGSLGPKFLKKLNSGDYKGAMEELTTINTELQERRKKERALFGTDISETNTLKVPEINPKQLKQDTTVTKDADFNQLKEVKDVKSAGGSAKTYGDKSDITSHTKLKEGYNQYYDPNKAGMGTFMGKQITSGIGRREVANGSSFHRGLDLAYAYGTEVRAFCSGVVTFAGVMRGFGKCVLIDDSRKFRHLYGHLSEIKVSLHKHVKKGDLIGLSGRSGTNAVGVLVMDKFAPHLHYGIWRPNGTSDKTAYVDPRTYTYPNEIENDYTQSNPKVQSVNNNVIKMSDTSSNKSNKPQVSNNSIKSNPNSINSNVVALNNTLPKSSNVVDLGKANSGFIKYDKNKPNKK